MTDDMTAIGGYINMSNQFLAELERDGQIVLFLGGSDDDDDEGDDD